MAIYQRQLGQNDVYDVSGAQPRYISFDEAQKNNIWNQVQDVPARTLDNRSPVAGAETSLNLDRGNQQNSYQIFNSAIQEMLRSAQKGLGTRQSQQAAIDLSNQQVQRGQAMATPGMNPSLQAGIRSADMNAINPSIQGAEDITQTFQERLSGFKDILSQTRLAAADLQDAQYKTQENARKMINDSITQLGSAAFEGVDENELKALEKSAGLPTGYLSRSVKTLKEKELLAKQEQARMAAALKTGGGTGGVPQPYKTNLDAVIDNARNTITTKYGLEQFNKSLANARNDADKINLIATVALKGAPAETRNDFIKQSQAVNSVDKAIKELDKNVQTGVLQNSAQYVYNVAGKDYDPKLAAINSYIISAIQPYRNSITGAVWGPQEDAEYLALFGSTRFSPFELRDRLVRIKEIMVEKSATALQMTVNPMGGDYNPFAIGNDEQSQVQAIINQNPNEWGRAASAVDAKFGKGTATKYDSLFQSAYNQSYDNYLKSIGQ